MKTNDIKLICSDIDGTLITSDDKLPDNFEKVLQELEKRNIYFVAASGRGVPSIKTKLDYKAENLYYISDNGAILQHDNKVFYKNKFSQDEVEEVVMAFRECTEASIIATTKDSSYAELHSDHKQDFLKEFYVDYIIVDDITKVDEEFVKITMRSDFNTDENIKRKSMQKLKKKYHLVRAGIPWIDVMRADSNKGKALETLLNYLNIDKKNTIGFGDYPNDIHMLEVVGRSYAMENAHPDVKKIADEIIGSNDDNSVMKKIIELLKI